MSDLGQDTQHQSQEQGSTRYQSPVPGTSRQSQRHTPLFSPQQSQTTTTGAHGAVTPGSGASGATARSTPPRLSLDSPPVPGTPRVPQPTGRSPRSVSFHDDITEQVHSSPQPFEYMLPAEQRAPGEESAPTRSGNAPRESSHGMSPSLLAEGSTPPFQPNIQSGSPMSAQPRAGQTPPTSSPTTASPAAPSPGSPASRQQSQQYRIPTRREYISQAHQMSSSANSPSQGSIGQPRDEGPAGRRTPSQASPDPLAEDDIQPYRPPRETQDEVLSSPPRQARRRRRRRRHSSDSDDSDHEAERSPRNRQRRKRPRRRSPSTGSSSAQPLSDGDEPMASPPATDQPRRQRRRPHRSTTEEDEADDRMQLRSSRRVIPKKAHLMALQAAFHDSMQEHIQLQIAEAEAQLRTRRVAREVAHIRQQLIRATAGWFGATPDMFMQAFERGTFDVGGAGGSGTSTRRDYISDTNSPVWQQSVRHRPVAAPRSRTPGPGAPFITTGPPPTPPFDHSPDGATEPQDGSSLAQLPLGFPDNAYRLHFPPLPTPEGSGGGPSPVPGSGS